jgi:hypothetical protein
MFPPNVSNTALWPLRELLPADDEPPPPADELPPVDEPALDDELDDPHAATSTEINTAATTWALLRNIGPLLDKHQTLRDLTRISND